MNDATPWIDVAPAQFGAAASEGARLDLAKVAAINQANQANSALEEANNRSNLAAAMQAMQLGIEKRGQDTQYEVQMQHLALSREMNNIQTSLAKKSVAEKYQQETLYRETMKRKLASGMSHSEAATESALELGFAPSGLTGIIGQQMAGQPILDADGNPTGQFYKGAYAPRAGSVKQSYGWQSPESYAAYIKMRENGAMPEELDAFKKEFYIGNGKPQPMDYSKFEGQGGTMMTPNGPVRVRIQNGKPVPVGQNAAAPTAANVAPAVEAPQAAEQEPVLGVELGGPPKPIKAEEQGPAIEMGRIETTRNYFESKGNRVFPPSGEGFFYIGSDGRIHFGKYTGDHSSMPSAGDKAWIAQFLSRMQKLQ
jgi:hypothetical protein